MVATDRMSLTELQSSGCQGKRARNHSSLVSLTFFPFCCFSLGMGQAESKEKQLLVDTVKHVLRK